MSKIDQLLNFDPLAEGERLTGISYKDKAHGDGFDNPATSIGFALLQENNAAKRKILTETDDTLFSDKLPRYRRIVERFGFEEVLADRWHSTAGTTETYFVFAHRKGLLLAFDTFFGGESINGGKVWYNWKPSVPWKETQGCRSSGSICDDVWVGYHDCREALIHNLNKLNNRGEFVCPWVQRPFLWLLNFDEPKPKDCDYKAITEGRVKRLPQWVQDFIGPDAR